MRVPNPSPVLDEHLAPMGGSRIFIQYWGKGLEDGPQAFPHVSSVLDKQEFFFSPEISDLE